MADLYRSPFVSTEVCAYDHMVDSAASLEEVLSEEEWSTCETKETCESGKDSSVQKPSPVLFATRPALMLQKPDHLKRICKSAGPLLFSQRNNRVGSASAQPKHLTAIGEIRTDDETVTTAHESTCEGSMSIATETSSILFPGKVPTSVPQDVQVHDDPMVWNDEECYQQNDEPASELQVFYQERLSTAESLLKSFSAENNQQQEQLQELSSCLETLQVNYDNVSSHNTATRERMEELECSNTQLERSNRSSRQEKEGMRKRWQEQQESLVDVQRRLKVADSALQEEQDARKEENDMHLHEKQEWEALQDQVQAENAKLRQEVYQLKMSKQEPQAIHENNEEHGPPMREDYGTVEALRDKLDHAKQEITTLEEELSRVYESSQKTQCSLQNRLKDQQLRAMVARQEKAKTKAWVTSILDELQTCKQSNRSYLHLFQQTRAQNTVLRLQFDEMMSERFGGISSDDWQEANKLQKKLEDARVKMEVAQQERCRLEQESQDLQEQNAQLSAEFETMSSKLIRCEDDMTMGQGKLRDEIRSLVSSNGRLQSQIDNMRLKQAASERSQQVLRNSYQSMIAQEKDHCSRTERALEEAHQRIGKAEDDQQAIQTELDEALKAKEQALEELEQSKADHNRIHDQYNNDLATKKDAIDQVEKDYKVLEDQHNEVLETQANILKTKRDLEQQLSSLRTQFEQSASTHEKFVAENQKLEEENEKAKSQRTEALCAMKQSEEKIAQVQSKYQETLAVMALAEGETKQLENHKNLLQAAYTDSLVAKETLQRKLEDLEQRHKELQQQVSEAKTGKQQVEDANQRLQAGFQTLMQTHSALTQKVHRTEEASAGANQRIEELRVKIRGMEKSRQHDLTRHR